MVGEYSKTATREGGWHISRGSYVCLYERGANLEAAVWCAGQRHQFDFGAYLEAAV